MNKKILRTLTALCAALMLSGGFSVTAFAQTPEGEDDTNDSGVVYEEPQKEEPLTPDGNATLVDDFGGNKQLITVTTKNGNYFYILIDRDDEGENTVHFLNQVDEADLLALMEDGSTEAAPPAVCSCTEKCEAGKVNVSCPVCKDNMTACSGKEAEPETEEPPELPKEKGNAGGLVLFLVVALLGGGGAFYYFKFIQFSKSFCERFLLCTPYTNRNPQGLFGIQFSKKILEIFDFFSRSSVFDVKSNVLFLCNSIFFIEIGCNAAFQRTATSKFDLDGILATPIYIRRTACTVL